MDHLPRPTDAESPIVFPYHRPAEWRRGTGISNYMTWRYFAEEHGFPIEEFADKPRSLERILQGVPFWEFAAFLQEWLYFGSLAIFLECDNVSLFTTQSEYEGKLYEDLDTSRLLEIAHNWAVRMIERFPTLDAAERKEERVVRNALMVQLNKSRGGIHYLMSSPGGGEKAEGIALQYIGLSVDLLQSVLRRALLHVVLETGGHSSSVFRPSEKVMGCSFLGHYLSARGWCPTDQNRLRTFLDGANVFCFATMIRRHPENPRLHNDCKEVQCVAYQVLPGTYQPKHGDRCSSSDAGGCRGVGLATNTAESILGSTNSFPVVRLWMDGSKKGDTKHRSFEAVSFEPGMRYVAISHVWSDGLGDEKGNQILACQYDRLADIVSQVMGEDDRTAHLATTSRTTCSNDEENGSWSPFFWLDTICVPHQHETRRLACARMASTYELAHTVLVLDSELQHWRYSQGTDAEALFRISTSGWMTRVWTLSEGILAKRLIFKFADSYFDLSDAGRRILDRMKSGKERLLSLPLSIHHKLSEQMAFKSESRMVNQVVNAFNWTKIRQTSHHGDEIVAVAVLLRLGHIEKLYDQPTWAKKMKLFLEMLPGIPPCLPFTLGPKMLGERGFRWAPSALDSTGLPFRQIIGTQPSASLDKKRGGFLCSFPGLIIHVDWDSVTRDYQIGDPLFRAFFRRKADPCQSDFVMDEEWWEVSCRDGWRFGEDEYKNEDLKREIICKIGRTPVAIIVYAYDFDYTWDKIELFDAGGILVSHVQKDEKGVIDCQYKFVVHLRKFRQITSIMDENGYTLRGPFCDITTDPSDGWGSYERSHPKQTWRVM